MNHTGAALKETRLKHGLTQDELADLLGVTKQYVHKAEAGKIAFPISYIKRWSSQFSTHDKSRIRKAVIEDITLALEF